MKPTHRYDTKDYQDYYIHQAGKGYPVGISNKSSSDFVHSHELGCTSAILIRKCHSICSVAWSADVWSFFSLGRSFYCSLSWGSYRVTHRYDTKDYQDYYIHQAGKGYPVFAGRRYRRGHGLGSIFGGLFKIPDILFRLGVCNNPGNLSYRNDELVSF
jgi:hypothetical protein